MLMKGQTSEPNVAYKGGTRLLNPEHNKPVTYLKPTIVKGSTQNRHEDANALAQIEAARTEQLKQQQRDKLERVDYMVRMNVSKLTEERSRRLNETRRIKEAIVVRSNNVKEKYTITPQSKVRKEAAKEGPKKIDVQPTKVVWKKASEANFTQGRVLNEEEQQPRILTVEPAEHKQRSVSPKPHPTSKEPQSRIRIPKELEQSCSSDSASEIDSDVNDREQSMKDVMGKFEKLRCILRKR